MPLIVGYNDVATASSLEVASGDSPCMMLYSFGNEWEAPAPVFNGTPNKAYYYAVSDETVRLVLYKQNTNELNLTLVAYSEEFTAGGITLDAWNSRDLVQTGALTTSDVCYLGILTGSVSALNVARSATAGKRYRFGAYGIPTPPSGPISIYDNTFSGNNNHASIYFAEETASAATLSSPTSASVTQSGATIGATTDDATGTLYGVVTTSASAPSATQIKAGQDHTGSAAAGSGSNASLSVGANTIAITGLTAATTYYYYLVQDNGSDSNVVNGTFATLDDNPTISSVTPSTLKEGLSPVIVGTNFEASQGAGTVKLSPTDNVDDVNAATQSITSWGDTSITLNGVSFPAGTSQGATLYLFVTNNTGDSNAAGSVVTASLAPTIHTGTVVNPSAGGFSVRFTSDVANGTAYYVVFQTTASDPSAAQIVAGTDGDGGAAVASGSMAISTTGEQTFPATTGLTQSVTYRVAVVHYGDSSA